eukprot:3575926-Pyramimonas_sp.AAC.1
MGPIRIYVKGGRGNGSGRGHINRYPGNVLNHSRLDHLLQGHQLEEGGGRRQNDLQDRIANFKRAQVSSRA